MVINVVVDMPYGLVVISNHWEATYFVQNHCRECWMSNETTPWSGEEACKCNKIVQQVMKALSKSTHTSKGD